MSCLRDLKMLECRSMMILSLDDLPNDDHVESVRNVIYGNRRLNVEKLLTTWESA